MDFFTKKPCQEILYLANDRVVKEMQKQTDKSTLLGVISTFSLCNGLEAFDENDMC